MDTLNSSLEGAAPADARAKVTMADLQEALDDPVLLPEGWSAEWSGGGLHWEVVTPSGRRRTVTTDRTSYEYDPEHVGWFGPESPVFPVLLSWIWTFLDGFPTTGWWLDDPAV